MQEIHNKIAFVVINEKTMQRVSKFYSRKSDAVKYINDRKQNYSWMENNFAIAEFEFKRYYVLD